MRSGTVTTPVFSSYDVGSKSSSNSSPRSRRTVTAGGLDARVTSLVTTRTGAVYTWYVPLRLSTHSERKTPLLSATSPM
jgi:hypothetical protein